MHSRSPFARLGPASHWGAGLAALLCNAALLGALATDFSCSQQPRKPNSTSALKIFALPAPLAPPVTLERTVAQPAIPHSQPARLNSHAPEIVPVPTPYVLHSAAYVATAATLPDASVSEPSPSIQEVKQSQQADDTIWAEYQKAIWAYIVAQKPAGLHMAGEAVLAFSLDRDGSLIAVRIVRPSGNTMLDRVALRSLRNAAPYPPPPEPIQARDLQFTIRFSFR
ncbi:MAG: TonB family protein [Sphingobium sp.]